LKAAVGGDGRLLDRKVPEVFPLATQFLLFDAKRAQKKAAWNCLQRPAGPAK
jgi:hypothetical protein